jgi:hypothetical protein
MGRIELESFDAWVRHLFDHPAGGPQWFADPDAPFWVGTADVTVSWVTRLFDDPLPVLAPYSDAQLGQGFCYLVSTGASDCMFALLDASVPLDVRVRCLRATTTLFRRLFAARCTLISRTWTRPAAGRSTRPATCGGTCCRSPVRPAIRADARSIARPST